MGHDSRSQVGRVCRTLSPRGTVTRHLACCGNSATRVRTVGSLRSEHSPYVLARQRRAEPCSHLGYCLLELGTHPTDCEQSRTSPSAIHQHSYRRDAPDAGTVTASYSEGGIRMIMPSALNFLIVGAMIVIFSFLWKMGAASLVRRNSDSPVGKAMAAIY